MRWFTRLLMVVVLVGIVAGAAAWYRQRTREPETSFRLGEVTRGEVLSTIDATGTLEPQEVIDVGAQVAGQILEFGKDVSGNQVDYGSKIEQGVLLARIDDSVYKAELQSAQASLEQSQAQVLRANADLDTANAKLDQAQRDWERAQKLGPSEALAQQSIDQYRATYEAAKAAVAVAQAEIAQAKAAVSQSEAALWKAQRNLSYCTINSPTTGTIIDRRVNIGQTVVASLNAPSLFLLAKDLRHMEVWVAVNEADISNIYEGQPVTFTADAFPGETFTGTVVKVRPNAQMTQNVVTYTVTVAAENPGEKLLPYLTANVHFEVSRRTNVLTVPNAALRWEPAPQQIAPDVRNAEEASAAGDQSEQQTPTSRPTSGEAGEDGGQHHWRHGGGMRAGMGAEQETASAASSRPATSRPGRFRSTPGQVWIQDGAFVRPVYVRVGTTDGIVSEVMGSDVKEGMQVVVGEQLADASSGQAPGTFGGGSPFTPQMRRGGRPGAGAGGGGGGAAPRR